MEGLFAALIVGGIAGWLAGLIMRGHGHSVLMNVVVGIIGGVLGGWLYEQFGTALEGGLVGSIITATIGAVLLLWLVGRLKL
jgi:uncharacterized membrane protein YeaQ/YmgE (transglycosylase-associated protein family)